MARLKEQYVNEIAICSIFRFVNNNLPEKVKNSRYIFTFARQHYACKQEKRKEATP